MTVTATSPLGAVEDGSLMWQHNEHLVEDKMIERAILRAIGFQSITIEEQRTDTTRPQPRLVDSVERGLCVPLLDVIVNGGLPPLDNGPCCGRCVGEVEECRPTCGRCMGAVAAHRMLVPAGASVVIVNCCPVCHDYLDADFAPVVWS